MMDREFLALTGAIVGAVVVAACGGSSSSGSGSQTAAKGAAPSAGSPSSSSVRPADTTRSELSLAADPSGQLRFTKSSLSAKAGRITIKFTNSASLAHNLTVQQGMSGSVLVATPTFSGGTQTVTVQLKPGTYTFYCTVPGHREAGMQGTLTVR